MEKDRTREGAQCAPFPSKLNFGPVCSGSRYQCAVTDFRTDSFSELIESHDANGCVARRVRSGFLLPSTGSGDSSRGAVQNQFDFLCSHVGVPSSRFLRKGLPSG